MNTLTEAEWQEQVTQAARLFGWRWLHVRRSIGKGKQWTTSTNVVGWPDLLCWKPGVGLLAIELKVGKKQPTVEQQEVLASLASAGVTAMVAHPEDWPQVEAALRRKAGITDTTNAGYDNG